MRRAVLSAAIVAAAILGSSTRAHADGPRFGTAGVLSISSEVNLGATPSAVGALTNLLLPASMLSIGGASISNNGGSVAGFSLAPGADIFLVDGLSVGADLLFSYLSFSSPVNCVSPAGGGGCGASQSQSLTAFGVAPRIGYNIPLTDWLSLWPKAYVEYVGYSVSNNGGSANATTVGAYAPLMFHVARHFFLGLGPYVATEVSANSGSGAGPLSPNPDKITSYGLFAVIGGWVKPGASADAPPPSE